jgi:NTP pyrophosphatase (non-canonical NTP hydrolase)
MTLDQYQDYAARTATLEVIIGIIKTLSAPAMAKFDDANLYPRPDVALDAIARELAPHWSHLIVAIGLAGEVGEYLERIKKHYGHSLEAHPLDPDSGTKELGDVMWYLAANARKEQIKLGKIGYVNVVKLLKRHPNGFTAASSVARVDEKT